MNESLYNVVFDGQIQQGQDIGEVKASLAKQFKMSNEKISRLFAKRNLVIKSGIAGDKAKAIAKAIESTGATCRIVQDSAQRKVEAIDVSADSTVVDQGLLDIQAEYHRLRSHLNGLHSRAIKASGYERQEQRKETLAWVLILSGFAAGWIVSGSFWWGIGVVFIGCFARTFFRHSGRNKMIAKQLFAKELLEHEKRSSPMFQVIVREFLSEAAREDSIVGSRLRRLLTINASELDKIEEQVKKANEYKDHLDYEERERKRKKEIEERKKREDEEATRKLEALQAAGPGAAPAVLGLQIKLHPSMDAETFSTSFNEFSVSERAFLMIADTTSEGIIQVPVDCIERVRFADANAGLSSEALVNRVFSAFTNTFAGRRVRVDLHIPIPANYKNAVFHYSGISFVISENRWAEVGPAWTRFAKNTFPRAPRCGRCGKNHVVADGPKIAARLGLSRDEYIRGKCHSCGAKLRFDPSGRGFVAVV